MEMKNIKEILHGNLLIFTLGDILRQLSMFVTFPYFSLYVQALGGNTIIIGLVNSLRPLAGFFIYPIAGYLADRYSRIKIIAFAGYLNAILYSIFLLAPDWRYLAFGNFLLGLMVFFFPAMNALMADSLPPQQRGIGYSLWIAIPSAVGILSPYLGGYIITILGVEYAMRFLYGLTIITSVIISTMNLKFLQDLQEGIFLRASEKRLWKILGDSYRDMIKILKWLPRSLKAFALMLMLSFFFNNITAPFWIVYGINKIGLSELQWGIILLISAVVNVLLLIPAGFIIDRFDIKKVLYISIGLSTLPIFLFPFSQGFIDTTLIFIFMVTIGAFLTSGAPTFMAQSIPEEKRGRVMSALGQGMLLINIRGGSGGPGMGAVLTIPSVLGSLLGGFVYRYNPTFPWLMLATSLIFNTVICIIYLESI
jgi:MFS family permease